MINIGRLLTGKIYKDDQLRYGRKCHQRPIVVWNLTRRCNLNCIHCYFDSKDQRYPAELSTQKAEEFIKDLAKFNIPTLIFSGGEPLLRDDLFTLITTAKKNGLKVALSTNGTLLTEQAADRLKLLKTDYVGVSVDGIGLANDQLRGKNGAFRKTLAGVRNCQKRGLKVGLRFTITRHNLAQVPALFALAEKEKIKRLCFYHLVYSGRGQHLMKDDLTFPDKRKIMDYIIDKTQEFQRKKMKIDVLTVNNQADGIYLYLRLCKENPQQALKTWELLKINGGNNSGLGIAGVDNLGQVHPDQFWMDDSLGNIKNSAFSRIWLAGTAGLLKNLRRRKELLKGRCRRCRFLDLCNGNLRIRAKQVSGDIWQEDPACYLTEEEIYKQ